jgi:tRNA (guanine-N7-)-methyltransferase
MENPAFGRAIRSFVLRRDICLQASNAPWTKACPNGASNIRPTVIDLEQAFGRQAPKILEIGFGMGGATAEIAAANPDIDYLGVEVHSPGVGNLCKLIAEKELSNLRIIRHDAVEVLDNMLADGSLDGVHIFFPDPWHKKRHNKRRLIQAPLVEKLVKKLKPGGYLHAATDWEDYAIQIMEVFSANSDLANSADGYAPRPDYRPLTKFEARGIKLGHGVWDIIFRRK